MKHYNKPYPTIGELIEDKNYDYVSYRISHEDYEEGVFAGCFHTENGEIIPDDGDIYCKSEKVIASEEWIKPSAGVKNGLMVIVEGEWL